MEALEAIRSRKSIRAFLPTPVPREVIAQILETSRWAPSAVNRQEWRVTVATGDLCRMLADRLVEQARRQRPNAPESTADSPGERSSANTLVADLTRIAEGLGQSLWEFVVAGSYRLYGAPAVVVVSHHGRHGGDVSQFVTTMLIAAHALGVGTCWLGYPLRYADLIREALGIPEGEQLGAVVALGYPDPDSPANAYRSPRDDLDTFVRWAGSD